jgi:hypothetical protein
MLYKYVIALESSCILFLYAAFRDTFDVLDAVNYIAVALLDAGIMLLYYFFEWYNRRAAKAEKQAVAETDSTHTYALGEVNIPAKDLPMLSETTICDTK